MSLSNTFIIEDFTRVITTTDKRIILKCIYHFFDRIFRYTEAMMAKEVSSYSYPASCTV